MNMEKMIVVKRRYLRKPARKIRSFIDVIKNKKISDAMDSLSTINKDGINDVILLIKSARAIAKQKNINEDDLTIKIAKVDQGPAMKRRWKRSRGSTTSIRKEFSHITLSIDKDEVKE